MAAETAGATGAAPARPPFTARQARRRRTGRQTPHRRRRERASRAYASAVPPFTGRSWGQPRAWTWSQATLGNGCCDSGCKETHGSGRHMLFLTRTVSFRRMPRRPSDQHIDNPAAVGRRLRQTRIEAGLSQRALAFPGCTPAYISRIEAGQRIPSLQLLRELANRIGVDVEYLARGDEASAAVTDPLAEAELDLRLGDVEAAEQHFSAVASGDEAGDRERARALAGLGQIAFGRGDSNGAIEAFERALELSPRL